MIRYATIFLAVITCGSLSMPAWAGEADDIQRMIDGARRNVSDLERLDERSVVRDELTLLRVWLDQAWRLRSDQKYDEVRLLLDRCDAQAEMIRQKITASNLMATASEKEAEVARVKKEVARLKQALQEATLQKAALEAKSK